MYGIDKGKEKKNRECQTGLHKFWSDTSLQELRKVFFFLDDTVLDPVLRTECIFKETVYAPNFISLLRIHALNIFQIFSTFQLVKYTLLETNLVHMYFETL